MNSIIPYDRKIEDHSDDLNNVPITGNSILSNPYTTDRKKAKSFQYIVGSEEESLRCYSHYYDVMYSSNGFFKNVVDQIYERYKNGENIYLEGNSDKSHGSIIASKINQRLIKERIDEYKKKNAKV